MSFSLSGNKICGLLGRNGAGKTTLLSILAGYERQTAGTVRVDGEPVFENATAAAKTCLVRGTGDQSVAGVTVRDLLGSRAGCGPAGTPTSRPRWSTGSRCRWPAGQDALARQAVRARRDMGLASRAPLTIFDESYLGMDAPSRYAFYDALLADVLAHPRMVIISTHLIEEVGTLFEDVLILDEGRLLLHEEADTLRAAGAAVTGDAVLVDSFTLGLEVLGEKTLGRTKSAMVYGPLDEKAARRPVRSGSTSDPIALQDLFVHLTSGGSRGADQSLANAAHPADRAPVVRADAVAGARARHGLVTAGIAIWGHVDRSIWHYGGDAGTALVRSRPRHRRDQHVPAAARRPRPHPQGLPAAALALLGRTCGPFALLVALGYLVERGVYAPAGGRTSCPTPRCSAPPATSPASSARSR